MKSWKTYQNLIIKSNQSTWKVEPLSSHEIIFMTKYSQQKKIWTTMQTTWTEPTEWRLNILRVTWEVLRLIVGQSSIWGLVSYLTLFQLVVLMGWRVQFPPPLPPKPPTVHFLQVELKFWKSFLRYNRWQHLLLLFCILYYRQIIVIILWYFVVLHFILTSLCRQIR